MPRSSTSLHNCKGAIAIVVVKRVAAECGHVKVFITIVVVTPYGNAHSITGSLQPCLDSYIFKGPIRALMIEPVSIQRATLLRCGLAACRAVNIGAIHQKHVQPPVIVVIQQSHAGPHGLDQITHGTMRGLVLEMNAARGGRI